MKINTWIKIGVVTLWLLGVTTCTSDEYSSDNRDVTPSKVDPFEDGSVPVKIPLTKSVNDADPENRVVSVRLIIIRDNVVTNNKVIANIANTTTNVELTDIAPAGYVDLFVIVNELSEWDLGLINIGEVFSSSILKNKVLSFTNYPIVSPTQPIPMFQMYENLRITVDGETLLNNTPVTLSSVKRLYAKVTLNLNCTYTNLVNGGDPIEIKQVSIKSIPKESYLAPTPYTETGASNFFDGSTLALKRDSNYTWTNTGFTSNFLCYIPEYLVSDITRYMYISAIVNLVTDVNAQREYKIVLGDGIPNGNTYMLGNSKLYSDVRISRNTHYTFTGNITSFDIRGEEDIEIRPQILVWEGVSVDESEFRVYKLTVSQEEFKLSQNTFSGVVDIFTDYSGGWSAVLAPKQSGTLRTTLTSSSGTSGQGLLKFDYNGQAITDADTIKVTAGTVTKQILIKN
ncbi:MAG: hypothetical protein LBD89_02905 [Tannerellaceae bacterium]|jgi:hypothetical protein|nr:hypothetical protein [Tannerellaceae bacterium]